MEQLYFIPNLKRIKICCIYNQYFATGFRYKNDDYNSPQVDGDDDILDTESYKSPSSSIEQGRLPTPQSQRKVAIAIFTQGSSIKTYIVLNGKNFF